MLFTLLLGTALVIDGDTLDLDGKRIRLMGIDAPEKKQICQADWKCGLESTKYLVTLINGKDVTCKGDEIDRYGRTVAECFVEGLSLNAAMVQDGYAVSYRRYSLEFADEEEDARAKKLGVWSGNFMMPWDWRKESRQSHSKKKKSKNPLPVTSINP